jgi:hypothetical protein
MTLGGWGVGVGSGNHWEDTRIPPREVHYHTRKGEIKEKYNNGSRVCGGGYDLKMYGTC